MKTLEEYLASRDQANEPVEKDAEFKLRYETDTIAALDACSSRYAERESGYREALRTDIATVYAHALRLECDQVERDRFYQQKYWKSFIKPSELKSARDLFRDVCKYFLKAQYQDPNGDGKLASKYSAVMAAMHAHDVFPEDVPDMIQIHHGIEKIARNGFVKPAYIDPRDVGDGMTAQGEQIIYPDEEEKKIAKRQRMTIDGQERIHDLYETLNGSESRFDVRATADVTSSGTELTVYSVEKNSVAFLDKIETGSEAAAQEGLVLVPVYMTAKRLERVTRMVQRRSVDLQLEALGTPPERAFKATSAKHPPKPAAS
ncbi:MULTISPECIES: hypothetical protein [unclassified Mesorhizobium]|uniref:hypothetical protein n=1 Tax=unclassified Mesorhizobium TaxID=325217 RepID=UPI003338F45B